ncbi:MAG: hypothetical protein JWQ35_535 [Bacteriovoracaceae bacterium]|nr:hypothetical protein [Bacteriovoracaceae bacterium]
MKCLTISLKRTSKKLPEPCLYIEGAESLEVKSPSDFTSKLRLFLDDMKNLKYLRHIAVETPEALTSDEALRLQQYAELIPPVIEDIQRSLGESEDSILGIQNLFENLPTILKKPDISHIKCTRPFHAVVVSAGPSLDLEIENLKKIQSKAILICVDAAFKTLLKNGIRPQVVVAMERDDHSVPFFKDLPSQTDSLLVCHATVKRILFESYPGPIATALKYTGPFLWLPFKRARFWTASSSAHLAYRLCGFWGAESIALVGQDLCYHPKTLQSHADVPDYPEWAAPASFENRIQQDRAFRAVGNIIPEVLTNATWSLFSRDYQVIVNEMKVPTFNTSKLGMKIGDIPFIPFEDWTKRLEAPSSPTLNVVDLNPDFKKDLAALSNKIEAAKTALTELKNDLQNETFLKNPEGLYEKLPQTPHFIELVLEVVFLDWVKTENLCLNADLESARSTKRDFLKRASEGIDRVLRLLPSKLTL